jgi:protein-disulfide isomerase
MIYSKDMYENPGRRFLIPGAIALFGIIVAVGVYLDRAPIRIDWFGGSDAARAVFRAPTPADHTLGNPDAPIRITEYCDLDALYCKQFEGVMEAVIAAYGPSGEVSWTYRHFPNAGEHPTANVDAQALECAAAEGGSRAFFSYLDAWSAATTTDAGTGRRIAAALGLPAGDFQTCVDSGAFADEVQASYDEAVAAGATGAPYTIVSIEGKEPFAIAGALPEDGMKAVIEASKAKLKE